MKSWVLSNLCRKDVLTFLRKLLKKFEAYEVWGIFEGYDLCFQVTGTTQYVCKNRRLLFKVMIRTWDSFSLRKHTPSLTKQRKRPWLKGLARKECSWGSNALSKHFTQNANLARSPYLGLLMFPFSNIKSHINKKSKEAYLRSNLGQHFRGSDKTKRREDGQFKKALVVFLFRFFPV